MILSVTSFSSIFSQEISGDDYILDHKLRITEHGFIVVEDEFTYTNNGNTETQLTSYELGYRNISVNDFSSIQINGPVNFEVRINEQNNITNIYFEPKSDYQISSGSSITISIQFYISNMVNSKDGGIFSAKLPMIPSMNIILDEVRISITLPQVSEIQNLPQDFNLEDVPDSKKITSITENVGKNDAATDVLRYNINPLISLPILEFSRIDQKFLSKSDGSVTVRDEISIINRGGSRASRVKLAFLNQEISSIDIVPIGNPPLVNKLPINVVDGVLDLQRGYGIALSKDEEFIFGIEYPLPSEYGDTIDGVATYEIPIKPPVDGVIRTFTAEVIEESGVKISETESLEFEEFTPFQENLLIFKLNPKIIWGSEQIAPIATLLFIIVLAVLFSQRTGINRGIIKSETPFIEDLISIFEEKIAIVEDISNFSRSKKKGTSNKISLSESKRYFISLKGKAAGRLGETRSQIVKIKPQLKNNLLDLSNADKDFNRAALDIIGLREKQVIGRMSSDTFERLMKKYKTRLSTSKDRIREKIDFIHDEIEK
jgi:hypothetical protein